MAWRVLRGNKLYLLLHTPWKCHFKAEVYGSTFCFLLSWDLPGSQSGPTLAPCHKWTLEYLLPLKGRLWTQHCWSTLNTFCICFFPHCFLFANLILHDGADNWPIMGSYVLNTTLTKSFQIDFGTRFTSFLAFLKSIKNAHFILPPLRKEKKPRNHRNATSSPVLPLVHPWDPSMWEVSDSGSVLSFPGGYLSSFFWGTTSIDRLLNSPRQNFA